MQFVGLQAFFDITFLDVPMNEAEGCCQTRQAGSMPTPGLLSSNEVVLTIAYGLLNSRRHLITGGVWHADIQDSAGQRDISTKRVAGGYDILGVMFCTLFHHLRSLLHIARQ